MVEALLVHAFTTPDAPESGNPAGVVLDASGLTDDDMQRIAAKVGASETAFILPSTRATRRVRFFTPECEIDFCGHATVAAWWCLAEAKLVELEGGINRLTQETNVGVLQVDIHGEAGKPTRVVMTQSKPEIVVSRIMAMEVAPLLGLTRNALEVPRAPVQVVSTGLKHLIIPVDSAERLANLTPDLERIAAYCEPRGIQTVHAFALLQERPRVRIKARAFAPHLGIPEDPATGTASGALGAYLVVNRVIPITAPVTEIRCEQGAEVGHASRIDVEISVQPITGGHKPIKVKVGGTATRVSSLDV